MNVKIIINTIGDIYIEVSFLIFKKRLSFNKYIDESKFEVKYIDYFKKVKKYVTVENLMVIRCFNNDDLLFFPFTSNILLSFLKNRIKVKKYKIEYVYSDVNKYFFFISIKIKIINIIIMGIIFIKDMVFNGTKSKHIA